MYCHQRSQQYIRPNSKKNIHGNTVCIALNVIWTGFFCTKNEKNIKFFVVFMEYGRSWYLAFEILASSRAYHGCENLCKRVYDIVGLSFAPLGCTYRMSHFYLDFFTFLIKLKPYCRVHISSDSLFSKILKKPSIVQKKMIPHMVTLGLFDKMKKKRIFFLNKKNQIAA